MIPSARKPSSKRRPRSFIPDDYLRRSQRPLHALLFLLPWVVIYELGTLIYATDYSHGVTQYIKARLMLMGFFEWFGVTGFLLPGLIVVGSLIGWHLIRRDPWEFEPRIYGLMLVESLILATPLLIFALLLSPQTPAYATLASAPAGPGIRWQAEMIFSVGAGLYEELLFRLVAIALLHFIFVDVLAIPDHWGSVAAVVLSAAAFALYHFSQDNHFRWGYFWFFTAAGIYLSMVYLFRGIGVAAGSHTVYDLMVVVIKLAQG